MDASLKRQNISTSIKKFFWDSLYSNHGYNVVFDKEFSPPENQDTDNWINILIENLEPDVVSLVDLSIYIFTRKDTEGNKINEIRDNIMSYLLTGHMDLYDETMTKFGGAMIYIDYEDGIRHVSDESKMISIVCTLKWGAKC